MKNINQNTASGTPEAEKDLSQTPPWLIDSVCAHFKRGLFDLDTCALKKTAKADKYYSLAEKDQNALELPWASWSWCNPPFSNITPFIHKAAYEAMIRNSETALIMPNNPETLFVREAKRLADQIVEMPFRLKFLRANGQPFVSEKTGKEQSPQFSCLIALINFKGISRPAKMTYHDFRTGFYTTGRGSKNG